MLAGSAPHLSRLATSEPQPGSHYVAVRDGRHPEGSDVRAFRAFTADLYALADGLLRCGIETVAMESTGGVLKAAFEPLLSPPRRSRRDPAR